MHKKTKEIESFLIKTQWLWACILLPIINLSALHYAHPLQENISHIASALNQSAYVLLWASACALYLGMYTAIFCKRIHYTKKIGWIGIHLSCLLMVVSVWIPYHPSAMPMLAKLHVDIAMLATLAYVISLLFLFHHLYFFDSLLFSQLMPWYCLIVGGCSSLFLLMGSVSTLVEITFVIGMGFFWLYALKKTASAV